MRALLPLAVCCLLAGPALAQRGGGGGGHGGGGMGGGFHGGGGMGGGGFRGGGGMGGGGMGGGGFRGGGFGGGGFHGGGFNGFLGGGFNNGFGRFGFNRGFNRFGFNRGFNNFGIGVGFGGYPYWGGGWGGGWDYPYWDGSYGASCLDYGTCGADPGYGYGAAYGAPAYSPSPGVTIISAPQYAEPAYQAHATPVVREYDEYGQEVRSSVGGANRGSPAGAGAHGAFDGPVAHASPVYLIAFNDHNIRAAQAYWVNGHTLHYVTMEHQERQVPLAEVDRKLSVQLNRERHVSLQLP